MTNKNSVKFKIGDLVYCSAYTARVCQIKHTGKHTIGIVRLSDNIKVFDIDDCSLILCDDEKTLEFVDDCCNVVRICHATKENYELLSKLYPNVTFEPPPKCKEPKEFIYDMLNNGYDVVNYIADGTFGFFSKHNIANITYREFNNFVYTRFINDCKDFKVITQKGEVIIDFVDGEVVLENESE